MLIPISEFELAQHAGDYDTWPAQTALIHHGVTTASLVSGYVIEAQYKVALDDFSGYLLITSYDCPFEESNTFLLLNLQLQVVSQKALQVPYGSFLLNTHWPQDAARLALHYYDDLFYVLTIKPPRRWFGNTFRLALTRQLFWKQDPRMVQESIALQASLDKLNTPVDESSDQ